MSEEVRSNVHCTNCGREFVATMDLSLNGDHVIVCPHCQHEHYRVVTNGVVTESRWRSSSAPLIYATTSMSITVSSSATTTNITTFSSWMNTTNLG